MRSTFKILFYCTLFGVRVDVALHQQKRKDWESDAPERAHHIVGQTVNATIAGNVVNGHGQQCDEFQGTARKGKSRSCHFYFSFNTVGLLIASANFK